MASAHLSVGATDELGAALAKVRELELSRDAMVSSIASLKVLVSNERALARVAKRKLTAATKKLEHSAHQDNLSEKLQQTVATLAACESEIATLREQKTEAERKQQSLQGRARRLDEQLAQRDKTAVENDSLREQLQSLRSQLATSQHSDAKKNQRVNTVRESAFRQELAEKDDAIHTAEKRWREEHARAEALSATVSDIPSLRGRIAELENDKNIANVLDALQEDPVDVERFDKISIKKKLFELKIARSVICEKDKILRDMKDKVVAAEARELEAVLACKVSEQHAKDAEDALRYTNKELHDLSIKLEIETAARVEHEEKAKTVKVDLERANEHVSELSLKVTQSEDEVRANEQEKTSLQQKAQAAERNLARASKELTAVASKVRQYEDEKKEQDEERESAEEQRQSAQERYDEIVVEVKNLKSALEASEKEVARLENIISSRDNRADELRHSSPCSTDAGMEEQRGLPSMAESESMEKLNELEEVAKLAKSSYEQKCLEAQALASSVSENATTIVTLNRALLVARNSCDEKHAQLEESMAKANSFEKSVRKLKTELLAKTDECEFLENRIRAELEPSLLKTNDLLDQRLGELKVMRDEYELHKEMSDKTRVALEQEVGGLSERLQDALTLLSGTQDKLTAAEQRAEVLEREITTLSEEKRNNCGKIEELNSQCEHRRQALVVLQERLSDVEESVAVQEQAAFDASQRVEELEEVLARARDRQAVAEERASRKDAHIEEIEQRALELERNHSSVLAHLTEKLSELDNSEREVKELKDVVLVTKDALERQALVARNREELFDSLAAELHGVITSRDSDLRVLREDLHTVERRAKSVTEDLATVNSTLAKTECDLVQSKRQHSDSVAENKRQQAKLVEMQDEISRLRAECQAAQEELVVRDQQIAGQLQSITEKGGKIAGLRAEKMELGKLVSEIRTALSSEQARGEAYAASVKNLESALTEASSDLMHSEEILSMKNTETETLVSRLSTAQSDVARLESVISDKDEEIKSDARVLKKFEVALERSRQQLRVLESHLNGHDTLLKDCREKEEALVVKCAELDQAKESMMEMENTSRSLREQLSARVEELERWRNQAESLDSAKILLEKELAKAQEVRAETNEVLQSTAAKLSALEKSTSEEIEDLKATNASLQKVLDDKESSLSSASEVLSQTSVQGQLTKEQLIDSRTRGDRLFEKLTAAEYELASKKESLAVLETKLNELRDRLQDREHEVERLERNLLDRSQALTIARSRVDELGAKTNSIAKGELLAMQTKLEAKEKAIANLHNWCCFINGKLHAAEKALSERQVDLEVSTTAFKKLEAQLQRSNECIAEKESQIRELESSTAVENSELRSRIRTMQSHVEEANMELEKTKWMMSTDSGDTQTRLALLSEELRDCKERMQAREVQVSQAEGRSQSLQETLKTYERDLSASQRTIESLTLDLGRLRVEVNGKRDAKDVSDKNAALEVSKVRSETGYLLVELRKAEAELAASNENMKTWQAKAEELQPLAESTLEAQRSIEMLASRLSLAENDSRQRIDLLETQLQEARRERDIAERDCAAALADYAAARARLTAGGGGYVGGSRSVGVCAVTFTLDGTTAPSSDVTVYVLGGDSSLGNWEPSRRVAMRVVGQGTMGVVRKCDVVLSAKTCTSYKFAADGPDGSLVWEGGENRILELQGNMQYTTHDKWRSPL